MTRLHNLRPRPGSRHRVKRLGCGESSGHGKTSGKGHKGQKARSGGSLRLGFEGGQMPLIRRLPKRGFNNTSFHKTYAVINLGDLNSFKAGTVVDEKLLREAKLVRGAVAGLKILADGELKHSLTIEADRVSTAAREKIEKAGGTFTLREARPLQHGDSSTKAVGDGETLSTAETKKGMGKKATAKGSTARRKTSAKAGSKKRPARKTSG
jgi:large subunit ribosomal protein L15